jgi:hypothetical protein
LLYRALGSERYIFASKLGLNTPTALFQFFWLRHHVKYAWLWPMVTIPLLMIFTIIINELMIMPVLSTFLASIPAVFFNFAFYDPFKLVALLIVGFAQGLLMHSFWQHPKQPAHAKGDVSTVEDIDNKRKRLQEQRSTQQWDQDDEQVLRETDKRSL